MVLRNKKQRNLFIKEQQEFNENTQICFICKEKCEDKYTNDKKYRKVKDHSHYTAECRDASHSICNSRYSTCKNITIIFQSRSNYDDQFIIK